MPKNDSVACVECGKESKYKCPQCSARYCSVTCFKEHKTKCQGKPKDEAPSEPSTQISNDGSEYTEYLRDPQIAGLLKNPTVRHHLRVVGTLARDAALSGEQTAEGRRAVALKKLRELRTSGREQNEAVEEFVTAFLRVSAQSQDRS